MRTIAVTEMDCPTHYYIEEGIKEPEAGSVAFTHSTMYGGKRRYSMLSSLRADRDRINKIPDANAQIWRRHIVGHGPRYALMRDVADNDLEPDGDSEGLLFWPAIDVSEYMDRGWTVIA